MPVHHDPRMTFDEGLELAKCVPEVKALAEATLRLLDICHFLTPSILYRYLGDDAAVAAGLPLWPTHYTGDPSARLDLTWAEATVAPFEEAPDA